MGIAHDTGSTNTTVTSCHGAFTSGSVSSKTSVYSALTPLTFRSFRWTHVFGQDAYFGGFLFPAGRTSHGSGLGRTPLTGAGLTHGMVDQRSTLHHVDLGRDLHAYDALHFMHRILRLHLVQFKKGFQVRVLTFFDFFDFFDFLRAPPNSLCAKSLYDLPRKL